MLTLLARFVANRNRDPKHNVGQASYRNRNTTWDRFQTGIETRKTTWDRGAMGHTGLQTGTLQATWTNLHLLQTLLHTGIETQRGGIKTGEKGQESYKKSHWNVPWGSERQGGDKKEGDKSHIKRVVGKEKVETKQQKDGVVFVSNEMVFDLNERVFNSNERVSNEMIFNSNEMGFNSNERVFKSKEMVSNDTVFRMNFKGNGFK
ncbi:hypothetical protein TNCV_3491401 [Trichonephila clavipes]|nr:hypothetical protein TNCV_3491401 [Trichonephila clavipes]